MRYNISAIYFHTLSEVKNNAGKVIGYLSEIEVIAYLNKTAGFSRTITELVIE